MPARAPASMDMLQMVSRASTESTAMVEPAYSMAWPVAPFTPIWAISASTTSLPDTPSANSPSTSTRMLRGLRCHSVWVASTCATSEAPMPKANAPSAPWVEVWLSPQRISIPGRLSPCSGPMTWTMPWRLSVRPYSTTPEAWVLRVSEATMSLRSSPSTSAKSRLVVGT